MSGSGNLRLDFKKCRVCGNTVAVIPGKEKRPSCAKHTEEEKRTASTRVLTSEEMTELLSEIISESDESITHQRMLIDKVEAGNSNPSRNLILPLLEAKKAMEGLITSTDEDPDDNYDYCKLRDLVRELI